MVIVFSGRKLEELCNDDRAARRKWGKAQAETLARRLDDLAAAQSLEVMRSLPGRIHELKAGLAGKLALDLKGGDRLLIEPAHDPPPLKPDGGLDWTRVTAVRVVDVGDYHD